MLSSVKKDLQKGLYMLEKEYEQLINYIEEMISNGIQLVRDGHLLNWNDTKIPEQIARIKKRKDGFRFPKLNPGDQLKHKVSKQDMWVINDDGKTVFYNPGTPIIKYPLDKILNEFVIVKRAKINND
jgi:hypothetical protein